MSSFLPTNFSSKIGSIGLITQSVIGVSLFPIIILNSITANPFIPKDYAIPLFSYVGYLIITLLFASIASYKRSLTNDKKCHYCGSALEVSKFKCKNPLCGKEQ